VTSDQRRLCKRERKPHEQIDDYLPRFLPDGHYAEKFVSWTEPVDVALSRKETSQMVREAIEELKVSVPLWKKETYVGGEEWIGQGS